MTWSPLACGIISGKYGNGVPESSRASLKVFPSTLRKEGGGGDELEGAEQQPRASQLEHTVALASHDLGRAPLSPAQVFAAGQASVSPS